MDPNVDFVDTLLKQVPELRELYEEHIKHDPEILPHVFFADMTWHIVDLLRDSTTEIPSEVVRLLDLFEDALGSGHEDVQELIGVSFVENLTGYGDLVARLRGLFGPNLIKEFKAFGIID